MATTHEKMPRTYEEGLVVDADLSSLGLPWKVFQRNSGLIREEYSHLSDKEFAAGSAKFLTERFLQRPQIYTTPYFYDKYEKQAQENLNRHVEELHNIAGA